MHDRHCGPLRKCTSAGTGLFRGVPLPLIKYLLLNTRLVIGVTLIIFEGVFCDSNHKFSFNFQLLTEIL